MEDRSKDKRKLNTMELAELSVMCALMFGGKEALRMIPNVHPVMLIIMLCVIWYGWKTMYPVIGFVVVEIALYGLGLWTIMYIYVWPLAVAISMPLRKCQKWWLWAVVAGLFGLLFGALCAIPYVVISGWKAAVAWWIAGIPFDLIHGVSNFTIVLILLPVLNKQLGNIKRKYM